MALNISTGTPGDAAPATGAFPANHKFYQKKFLEALQPAELYHLWGDVESIPANNSNTIVKNKISELSDLNGSPLTEGVTPTEQNLDLVRIEKSLNQYGGYMTTTDRLVQEALDGVTIEFTKRLSQQAARTMNKVRRDGLLGGSNLRAQNGVTPTDADPTLDDSIQTILINTMVATDMDFMLDSFRQNLVRPFTQMTGGSGNEGTQPIAAGFPVLVPVEAIDIIESVDGFNKVETYTQQTPLLHENEFGRYRNFRFIYDTEVKTLTNAHSTPQTIAQCLIFGQGLEDKAYTTVDLAGGNMQLIMKELGSGGTTDPLNQRATMGWKAKQATFIHQDSYMFRWEISLGDA